MHFFRDSYSRFQGEILEALLEWVFPEACTFCGGRLSWKEKALCRACLKDLPHNFPSRLRQLDALPAASRFAYEDAAKEMIKRLKSKHAPSLTLALLKEWKRPAWVRGALVPVPPDPIRRRERGFDPVLEIASVLQREWELPIECCLGKIPREVTQKSLNAVQRHAALEGVFFMKYSPRDQKPFILVDDVLTTGATLRHCVDVLSDAGLTCGGVLTLADTPSKLEMIDNMKLSYYIS